MSTSRHQEVLDRLNTAKLKHEVMSELNQLIRAPLMGLLGKIEVLEKAVQQAAPDVAAKHFGPLHDETDRLLMTLKVLSDASNKDDER